MTKDGTCQGDLNLGDLRYVSPQALVSTLQRGLGPEPKQLATGGALLLTNAYLDALAQKHRLTANNTYNVIARKCDELTQALRHALLDYTQIAAPQSDGNDGGVLQEHVLQAVLAAPESAAAWLQCAGQSSLAPVTLHPNGKALHVRLTAGVLVLPLTRITAPSNQGTDVVEGALPLRALTALLQKPLHDGDAKRLAQWIYDRAQRAFMATEDSDASHVRDDLRQAFQFDPSFYPEALRVSPAGDGRAERFAAAAWDCCREVLHEHLSTSAMRQPRSIPWDLLRALCERRDLGWHSVLGELVQYVPLDIGSLSDAERAPLAALLPALPVRAPSMSQVEALATWYAANPPKGKVKDLLALAAGNFLKATAGDDTAAKHPALYSALATQARRDAALGVQALLDVFPAHARLVGFDPALAVRMLMVVDEKYLKTHASVAESLLNVLLANDCFDLVVFDKETLPRWRTLFAVDALQPIGASLLQREYAAQRPAPSAAHLLQQAIAQGSDVEVGRRLDDFASQLPSDASLYVRLHMALAERGRAAKRDLIPKRRTTKGPDAKSIEKCLLRLEAVLTQCASDLGFQSTAQTSTTEPQPIDFLRQEMGALAGVDLSVVKEMNEKLSLQAPRQWGQMLTANLGENVRELLTLTQLIYQRGDFSAARELMNTLLGFISQTATLDTKEKDAIEARLRAWSAEAPHELQDLAQAFGAKDFADNLRLLQTAADKGSTSEQRKDAVQKRLSALETVKQTLATMPAAERLNRQEQIARVLPQILGVMANRNEREALGDFWPFDLDNLPLRNVDFSQLSLTFAGLATSNDASRPQVAKLLNNLTALFKKGLTGPRSAPQLGAVSDAFVNMIDEGGWTRALKLMMVAPKVVAGAMSAESAIKVLSGAPVKVLRDHSQVIELLAQRFFDRDDDAAISLASPASQDKDPWSDAARASLLVAHLDPLTVFRLLDRVGVRSDSQAAQSCLKTIVANKQSDVLRKLIAPSSPYSLARGRTLYWAARDALAALTSEPTALLQQLAEVLHDLPQNADGDRGVTFLRKVLRLPSLANVKSLDPAATDIVKVQSQRWYEALRASVAPSNRMTETLSLANLCQLAGGFDDVPKLVEELLLHGQPDKLRRIFAEGDAPVLKAALAVFDGNISVLRSGAEGKPAATHLALQAMQLALLTPTSLLATEAESVRASLVEAFADGVARSPLLKHLAVEDRPVLTRLLPVLMGVSLSQSYPSASLAERLMRMWVDLSRNGETGKQLSNQLEAVLAHFAKAATDSANSHVSTAIHKVIDGCLEKGQAAKAWRLVSLLPDKNLRSESLAALLVKNPLCPVEARSCIPEVLALVPSATRIPGLIIPGDPDKSPWTQLLKVQAALPWLAVHLHHMIEATGTFESAFASRWQAATARLRAAEQERVLVATLAELPLDSAMYLRACRARMGRLQGTSLLAYVFDVLAARKNVDDTKQVDPESRSLAFLLDGLKQASGADFGDAVTLSETQHTGLELAKAMLKDIPVADRVCETETMTALAMQLGDWLSASAQLCELLTVGSNEVLRGRVQGDAKRPKAWELTRQTLVELLRAEQSVAAQAPQYQEAQRLLLLSTPLAAFDGDLKAGALGLVVRIGFRSPSASHRTNAVALFNHVKAAIESADEAMDAKTLSFCAERANAAVVTLFGTPTMALPAEDAPPVEMLAWFLALGIAEAYISVANGVRDLAAMHRGFIHILHQPEGMLALAEAMVSVHRIVPGNIRAGRFTQGLINFASSALMLSACEDTMVPGGYTVVQAIACIDLFFALAAPQGIRREQGRASVLVSALEALDSHLDAEDRVALVHLAGRLVDRDEDMLLYDTEVFEEARGTVWDITMQLLSDPTRFSVAISYLLERADFCVEWTKESAQELNAALQPGLAYEGLRCDMLRAIDEFFTRGIEAMVAIGAAPCDLEPLRNLGHFAPVFYAAFDSGGARNVSEQRAWLTLALAGMFVNGGESEDDVELAVNEYYHNWKMVVDAAMNSLNWVDNELTREQIQLRLDNAHALRGPYALRVARQDIHNAILVEEGTTFEDVIHNGGSSVLILDEQPLGPAGTLGPLYGELMHSRPGENLWDGMPSGRGAPEGGDTASDASSEADDATSMIVEAETERDFDL